MEAKNDQISAQFLKRNLSTKSNSFFTKKLMKKNVFFKKYFLGPQQVTTPNLKAITIHVQQSLNSTDIGALKNFRPGIHTHNILELEFSLTSNSLYN